MLFWKTKLFIKTSKLIKYVQLKLESNSLSIKKIQENIPKINKYLNGVGYTNTDPVSIFFDRLSLVKNDTTFAF